MRKPEIKIFHDGVAMGKFAASIFRLALLKKKGVLTVALPGGRTPEPLFKALSSMRLPWDRAVFFMGDERRVPFCSPESNFGAAARAFFSRARVPDSSLRAPVSAAGYERVLLRDTNGSGGLDLVFLGLGTDGHIASIFPDSPAERTSRLVVPVTAPKGVRPEKRITLTSLALRRARTVVVMAAGREKKGVFLRAAAGDTAIPAGSLVSSGGSVVMLFSERK